MPTLTRRTFLASSALAASTPFVASASQPGGAAGGAEAESDWSIQMDPELVRGVVGMSHFNLDGVTEAVERQPELAKAAWDWGFGDVESAIGAASHVGRREIAEVLIAHGARPTLFTHAMLGHLDVVRAAIEATPALARARGPHGFTMMHHAKVGGDASAAVAEYLKGVEGSDNTYVQVELESPEALFGRYTPGDGVGGAMIAEAGRFQPVSLKPEGDSGRGLIHMGGRVFHPVGAESVRMTFSGGSGDELTISVGGRTKRFIRV